MIRRVITDDDIRQGRVQPPLMLDDETLLTPQARDRACALGWPIHERGQAPGDPRGAPAPGGFAGGAAAPHPAGAGRGAGGGAGCATAASSGASCARCGGRGATRCACPGCGRQDATPAAGLAEGVPDGLYLVRVQDGRTVSIQAAAGAGLMKRRSPA